MTQEEKQLVLKDLTARLPYGVIALASEINIKGVITDINTSYNIVHLTIDNQSSEYERVPIDDIKPYLRPMSSMTKEERKVYMEIGSHLCGEIVAKTMIDWLNKNHFDYRGLIETGLALEAPPEMYNKEEAEKGGEVPIPKTVDEAVKTLAKIVSKEDRDYLLENGAISMHHSMGRWIRNEWGLWTGSELKNELKKKGFEHPDDMSNYIIEEFIKYWNNKI